LQQAGYATAFVGKWHMGGSSDAVRPGFDHWVSFPGQGSYAPADHQLNVDGERVPRKKYMTDELTDYAVNWLRHRSAEQPFLLYLSHKGVHGLYDPAPRHVDRYQHKTINLPAAVKAPFPADSGKPMWVQDQRNSWHGVEFPYHGRSGQSLAEMYRHYCEMILSVDESVGRVMQALNDRGLREHTLVLFTSDGGHLWGEQGLIDKRCAYEPSIRIPMLAHCPALVQPKTRCDALVANIDVAPTFLELAGLNVPDWIDGNSFAKLLTSPSATASWRRQLLYEYYWEPQFPQTPTLFCLREERYKLIQYHGIWDLDELYDLKNDPGETSNLILDPEYASVVTRMRRDLYQELQATNGLVIPLGFKRNLGSNGRRASGSERAEFPSSFLRDERSNP
jgi:N-acetylglucosamine-6-sulfatase